MKRSRIEYIIPAVLSLVLAVVLVRLIPVLHTKFQLRKHSEETFIPSDFRIFHDMDGDGTSEELTVYINASGNQAVNVARLDHATINQFNLPGRLLNQGALLDMGDINQDGIADIFICTEKNDSLFLTIIDDLFGRPTVPHVYYADRLNRYNDNGDYLFTPGGLSDLNRDGSLEYLFAVNGGHSLQPRAVYAVDYRNGSVARSPESGAAIVGLNLFDLDRDGTDEILLNTVAPENFKTSFPYRDSVSWLMVLDHTLGYYRQPRIMQSAPSSIQLFAFLRDGNAYVIGYQKYRGTENGQSELFLLDHSLRKVRSKYWRGDEMKPYGLWQVPGVHALESCYLLEGSRIYTLDSMLRPDLFIENEFHFNNTWYDVLDIDGNGNDEYVSISDRNVAVYNERLELTAAHDIHVNQNRPKFHVSLLRQRNTRPLLAIQVGTQLSYFSYRRTWAYRYRGFLYPVLFLSLFMLFFLVVILQGRILSRRYEKQQLIHNLKLQAIRNQLDPHFTYNALNAVGSLIYKDRKEEAYRYMKGLSDLLRMVSGEPGEITWSLSTELEFVLKFLDIEKLRFREKFHYQLKVDDEWLYRMEVPRLSILTFVENAIKHGLRHKESDRELTIHASGIKDGMRISIRDNGIGRTASARFRNGRPGKGIEMMSQYFDQFNQYSSRKASFEVKDLAGNGSKVSGTLVEILIA